MSQKKFVLIVCLMMLSLSSFSNDKLFSDHSQGELDLFWYTSVPFIYLNDENELEGIEFEILEYFKTYLNEKKGFQLKLNWKKAPGFAEIIDTVRHSNNPNVFGVSAFSITDERKRFLGFTPSYLPDITVLVSSAGSPIVHGYDEIYKMLNSMDAITIRGTIYETLLMDLKRRLAVDFSIKYIPSDRNILDYISLYDDAFGFIDLPIYMMRLKGGEELTRQNFLTFKGEGYGFIMPQNSTWDEVFMEFLSDPSVREKIDEISSKYLGEELYSFINTIYDNDQLGTIILTKEKEMQLALIQNANFQLEKEKENMRFMVLGMVVAVLFLIVIAFLFFNNSRKTKLLLNQKRQIEVQQESIYQKNEQLVNRNAQLLGLNEERNHLVRILAHDLRAPLNHIISVSSMLSGSELSPEDRQFMGIIEESANTMSQMITKILDMDALEQNKQSVIREEVLVKPILLDVVNRYRQAASQKEIDIEMVCNPGEAVLNTDHLLLFLILENLLSNAIKFSSLGSKVEIAAEEVENTIVFRVRDEGPGFTQEDKQKAFGRFQKLSARPTAGESSTGLGLSIVKKYVGDLGGQVWLESEPGQGSTFLVSLPL